MIFSVLLHQRNAVLVSLGLLAGLTASAQTIKPGLWEFGNKLSSGNAALSQQMAEMQKELASLPPEQRQAMQEMMAKNGVNLNIDGSGAMRMKLCITKEMAERSEIPAGNGSGNCQRSVSPRVGNTLKTSFTCTNPPSNGEGVVTFAGSDAFSVKMTTHSTVNGKRETLVMDGSGKWLGSDCGSIKPIIMPRP